MVPEEEESCSQTLDFDFRDYLSWIHDHIESKGQAKPAPVTGKRNHQEIA